MKGAPKISVLMPAYNEGARIQENIRKVHHMLKGFKQSFEIVVVDDGSGDWTIEEARKAARGLKEVVVKRNEVNQGKGWALKEAFRMCRGDWVVFMDSDLDLDPEQVKLFFNIQKRTGCDIVIGSKRHPESRLDYPFKRRVISAGYFFMVKMLFGLPIRDTQTGLKLFKREVLQRVFPKVMIKRYAFDLELLVVAHHLGYTIEEAPVIVQYRGKFGHIGLRSIWNIFGDTMGVLYRLRVKKHYDREKA